MACQEFAIARLCLEPLTPMPDCPSLPRRGGRHHSPVRGVEGPQVFARPFPLLLQLRDDLGLVQVPQIEVVEERRDVTAVFATVALAGIGRTPSIAAEAYGTTAATSKNGRDALIPQ